MGKSAKELEKIYGYTTEELDKMAEPWENAEPLSEEELAEVRQMAEARKAKRDLDGFLGDKVKWRYAEISDFLNTEEEIAAFVKAAIDLDDSATLEAAIVEARRAAERLDLHFLDYRCFFALAGYSEEDGCLVGRVFNVDENVVEISFDGETPEELRRHFEESVDCYLGAREAEVIGLPADDFDRFAEAVEKGGMPDKVKQLLAIAREPRWADEV